MKIRPDASSLFDKRSWCVAESKQELAMAKQNSGYVYACGWNRLNMGVIGAWPEENQNFITKNRVWAYAILIFVIIYLPQAASLIFLRDDLKELIGCLVINVSVGISIFKLVLFRLRREVIVTVLTSMTKDWSKPRTKEEEEVMLEKAKYGRFISKMSVTLLFAMFFAFSIVGAWSAKQQRQFMTNDSKLAVGFLYPAYFPYDTTELGPYLPTWFGQLIGTIFSMVGYSAPDSLMAMMILHLCGQLGTLRIALENIVDGECIADPRIYWRRLSSIVERHEELNRYGELLEGSFNLMFLTQIVLCTLTFCFQGFITFTTLIEGLTGDQDFPVLPMIFMISYGCNTIIHLFVNCWAGDLLAQESTSLSYAPYESDWFLLPPAQANALMMVTNRARIPLQITAGKFIALSLELFTSIMKTSMGYLSVLLAMQDD